MGDDRWQVSGSAAEVYERQLVPAIFGPWAPRVLDLAAPAVGERVRGRGGAPPGGNHPVQFNPGIRARPGHRVAPGRPIAAADPADRAGLLAAAESALAPWQTPDELAFPIEALLLSGRVP